MNTTPTRVNHTFPPIYDQNSKILILGTFPSVKSREGDFYYHHPQNRFWKVLSRIFEMDVPQTIEDKKKMLLENNTAIWDVIASCEIIGSSDASIKNIVPADISVVLENSPIERIYANGNKAYELYMKHCFPTTGREIIKLPSTSPANAVFSLDKLVSIWGSEIVPDKYGNTPIASKISSPIETITPKTTGITSLLNLNQVCHQLSISLATGRNWLKSGRLVPSEIHKKAPLFSQEYVDSFQETLQTGEQTFLKSRRNKNYISGNQFYDAYLLADSPNIRKVKALLERIEESSYPTNETGIGLVLADCALQLYRQNNYVNPENNLLCLINESVDEGNPLSLLTAFIPNRRNAKTFLMKYPEIFSIEYTYVPREDLLGLLYLSMRHMGNRKTNGAYYTPVNVVKQLLNNLTAPGENETLLDPCCGTGNFLLQLSSNWKPEQLYASDIDRISVAVTRINLSLKFPQTDMGLLRSHVQCQNFLLDKRCNSYNYIIGNPPWGFAYSEEEKATLRQDFVSAGKNPESYDLFVERALQQLHHNGTLAFVLPEAILSVKSHKAVRQLICDCCKLQALTYLGNIFDGVWCPSVILQLVKTNQPLSVLGLRITDSNKHFTIEQHRPITADNFHLAVTDKEYALLSKIENLPSTTTLKGNADFALGIVTGDNKKYLFPAEEVNNRLNLSRPHLEPVLKGADIEPYHINPAKYYIDFQPKHLQQCAPVEMYRAPEKLVYRFIGQKLIFAYDDRQHISLNSCNILIPHTEGLHIKYILTILNSRTAQFYVQKKWNSLKVLRSHLEQIPIPLIPAKEQEYYIEMADRLMQTNASTDSVNPAMNSDQITHLYNELDQAVAALFKLSHDEYALMK